MRVLPPPLGRMSVISPLRWAIFSTTVPACSSSTSMTTVSYGSSRPPSAPSRNSTRGRLIDELEALAAHRLDQHAELELAAAGDLEGVLVGAFGDLDGDVAFGLAHQPVADHAARDLVALAPGIGAVVDREAHRQRRRIDRLRGDRRGHRGVGDGVGDGRLGEPGDGDDVAGLGVARPGRARARGRRTPWWRGRLDHLAVDVDRVDRHVDLERAALDPAGQDAAEELVAVEQGDEHGEPAVGVGGRARARGRRWSGTAASRLPSRASRDRRWRSRRGPRRRAPGSRAGRRWRRARRTGRTLRRALRRARASGRSILLTTTIGRRPSASALPVTNLVCGIGPSAASTSRITPSTMTRMRSTSPPKSAWPGVSTMLMRVVVPGAPIRRWCTWRGW